MPNVRRWAPLGLQTVPTISNVPANLVVHGGQRSCMQTWLAVAGALEEVGAALLAVWRRNARSARLATPLLRLADTLLATAGLGRLQPPASAFPGMLIPVICMPLQCLYVTGRLASPVQCDVNPLAARSTEAWEPRCRHAPGQMQHTAQVPVSMDPCTGRHTEGLQ